MGKAANGKRGRPRGRRPTRIIFVRVRPELADALDIYLEKTKPHANKTAVVTLALERLFAERGLCSTTPDA